MVSLSRAVAPKSRRHPRLTALVPGTLWRYRGPGGSVRGLTLSRPAFSCIKPITGLTQFRGKSSNLDPFEAFSTVGRGQVGIQRCPNSISQTLKKGLEHFRNVKKGRGHR